MRKGKRLGKVRLPTAERKRHLNEGPYLILVVL